MLFKQTYNLLNHQLALLDAVLYMYTRWHATSKRLLVQQDKGLIAGLYNNLHLTLM